MQKLSTLIFDVDGTLAETERDGHRIAFNRAFADASLDWDWSESLYGELLSVAGGKERIRYYLKQYKGGEKFPDDLIVSLHEAKTEHYLELLAEGGIPLRPGVLRLLLDARDEKLRLAIATTSALPNVLALLDQYVDPKWFEVIAAGDIVPKKKPAPDIYQYVLAEMDLKPDSCLVFEDSTHGLQAATAAGLTTVVTVNDYTVGQNFDKAALVLDHLGEPDLPFGVFRGDVGNKHWMDLELMESLLSKTPGDKVSDSKGGVL